MADAAMDATLTPTPTFDGICAVAGDNSAGRPLLEAILGFVGAADVARLACVSHACLGAAFLMSASLFLFEALALATIEVVLAE